MVVIIKVIYSCKSDIDGLVQDCSNSIANTLELLQFWTENRYVPVKCYHIIYQKGNANQKENVLPNHTITQYPHMNGLAQDCSKSSALAIFSQARIVVAACILCPVGPVSYGQLLSTTIPHQLP